MAFWKKATVLSSAISAETETVHIIKKIKKKETVLGSANSAEGFKYMLFFELPIAKRKYKHAASDGLSGQTDREFKGPMD